uniref:Zn(2)-C6 fungal-type domain-containing protein n=1 Tax=Ganoderma boninense TaxID=34458 RepID=A0A5K1K030_9APHY|nr:Zn(2)-C6 fungal-type domain-containing protein [Ganoderma boninense]
MPFHIVSSIFVPDAAATHPRAPEYAVPALLVPVAAASGTNTTRPVYAVPALLNSIATGTNAPVPGANPRGPAPLIPVANGTSSIFVSSMATGVHGRDCGCVTADLVLAVPVANATAPTLLGLTMIGIHAPAHECVHPMLIVFHAIREIMAGSVDVVPDVLVSHAINVHMLGRNHVVQDHPSLVSATSSTFTSIIFKPFANVANATLFIVLPIRRVSSLASDTEPVYVLLLFLVPATMPVTLLPSIVDQLSASRAMFTSSSHSRPRWLLPPSS